MNLSTPATYLFTSEPLNTTNQPLPIPVEKIIFETAVILIGIVGALGNGTVLYVLCSSKHIRKQQINVLLINQLSLDFYSCLWLLVEYPVKMANIYLEGPTGHLLCLFIISEDLSYFGIFGSKVNLMSIAIERYVKIVHPIWHKNNFKSWMIYSAAVVPWVVGVFLTLSMTSLSISVVDGQCLLGVAWINESVEYGFTTSTLIITFILPLASFFFCYSSIIYVIRRQTKIVASQRVVNQQGNTYSNTYDNRLQLSALKTMIIISAVFVVCWLPCDLYILLTLLYTDTGPLTLLTYYVTLLAGFLNICVNPFIYALKYDVVKKRLFSLMGVSCYNSEPENSTSTYVLS